MADTVCRQVRDSDIIKRLGGGEFGVTLDQNNAQVAEVKLVYLADAIANKAVLLDDQKKIESQNHL